MLDLQVKMLDANNPYLVFPVPENVKKGGRALACPFKFDTPKWRGMLPAGRLLNYASSPLQVAARQFLYRCGQRDGLDSRGPGDRSLLQHVYISRVDGDRGFARSWPGGASARRNAARDRLFPWIWGSLALNFLSGFLMFAGSATAYYRNDIFYDKLGVILLAIVANIIVQQKVRKWDQLPAMPAWAKLLAVVSIGLWIGAIIAGVEVPALTGVG